MKIAILSDIHGNLNALNAVLQEIYNIKPDAIALLGDLIDYGMRSNEVIETVKKLPYPIICNLRGNHEDAVINSRYDRFSSDRGRDSAKHTGKMLNSETWNYIKETMLQVGKYEFDVNGKKIFAVHGNLADEYWKSISTDSDLDGYKQYDYVLSGHSHLPHMFEKYYTVDNPSTRNKKKTIFINPGSVGQPRNLNSKAQFAFLDTETEEVFFKKVDYDIIDEQKYFDNSVDEFYKNRLKEGV